MGSRGSNSGKTAEFKRKMELLESAQYSPAGLRNLKKMMTDPSEKAYHSVTPSQRKTLISEIDKRLNTNLSDRDGIINFVKKQTNIDLSKVLEPKNSRSRTYLGVHLDDLGRNQRNAVTSILNKYGVRIESNGGYGDAIYFKK